MTKARPLRIALVAPLVTQLREPHAGGSQALLGDLAAGLGERGHTVDVYAASGSVVPGAHVIDTGVDSRTLAPSLYRHDGAQAESALVTEAFEHVFAMAGEREYDVVHNHAFDPAALRRSRAGKAAVVHTVHLPPQAAAGDALREALQGSHPATLVGVSAAQARDWAPIIPFDQVIRNGVPVERIPWSANPASGLVFAGRLTPEKGVGHALEIARRTGRRIDVYGNAYDVDHARAIRHRHEGRDGAVFHGALPRAGLWERLSTACAVLCPIEWDEPFGLVAAEAQAAGTPVVGFARGGLVEVVDHGSTGYLVAPGDVGAAVAAVQAVGAIDRTTCRRHALRTLDLAACLNAHEALYRACTSARHQSPRTADG